MVEGKDLEKIAKEAEQTFTAEEHKEGICPKTKQNYDVDIGIPRKGINEDTEPYACCKSCGAILGTPRKDYSK